MPTRQPWPARRGSCCSASPTSGWRSTRGRGTTPKGIGWYFLWATGVSIFIGLVTLFDLDDWKFTLLWLLWAILFATFFAVIALERTELVFAAGWLAIMEAFTTASIPGGLEMIDRWDDLPTIWIAIATVAVIGVFGALSRRRPHARLTGSRGSIAATTITTPPMPSSTSPTEYTFAPGTHSGAPQRSTSQATFGLSPRCCC